MKKMILAVIVTGVVAAAVILYLQKAAEGEASLDKPGSGYDS